MSSSNKMLNGTLFDWKTPETVIPKPLTLKDALISSIPKTEISNFLDPQLETDPLWKHFDKITEVLAKMKPGRVFISADYDVDGTTSGIILGKMLGVLGWDVGVFVPDRFKENYGVNYPVLDEEFKRKKFDLLITADCGATELFGLSEFGKKHKIPVCVIDHHKRGKKGDVVEINPHMFEDIQASHYCTGVLCFMLAKKLSEACPQISRLMPEIELLAGLSAMADVISMKGTVSRWLAKNFLAKGGTQTINVGISALVNIAELKGEKLTSTDVGFKIVPMINAAGRLKHAALVLALFDTASPQEAETIAFELQKLNTQRKQIQETIEKEAMKKYNKGDKVLAVADKGWHAGVVGPAAGTLSERLNIPVFLGGLLEEKGVYSFSARSASGIDIHGLVTKSMNGRNIQFGGHKVALGMKIEKERIDILKDLSDEMNKNCENAGKGVKQISRYLTTKSVSFLHWNDILSLEPFGIDNPSPFFCIPNVKLSLTPMASNPDHARGLIEDQHGSLPAVVFRSPMLSKISKFEGHVVGEFVCSKFRNETVVKFNIKDLIPTNS